MADQPSRAVPPEGGGQSEHLVRGPSRDAPEPHEAEWARLGWMHFQAQLEPDRALPGVLAAAAVSVAAEARAWRAKLQLQARAPAAQTSAGET